MRRIFLALIVAAVAISTVACTGGGCSTCGG
jgi:hypothetical protein